jgi:uncharacterized integral membrane protein
LLRLLLAIPILLLLVLFALSNRQEAQIGIWPTDFLLRAPLSLIVLVGMGFAFLCGALCLWVGVLAERARARAAERRARLLEAELAGLKARLAAPPALPRPVSRSPELEPAGHDA